ncbi:MAG: VTC domain-containing protein, partial [Polyangiaceae bacterium]|nr:VTC domain-containing protein [Polyangiaceae bacterium]
AQRRHFETFRYLQATYRAEPRLYVASCRTAFSSRTPGQDVRVTLDRALAYQPAHGLLFRPEAGAWRSLLAAATNPRWAGLAPVLIECKFRGTAPRWLGEATQRVGLVRTAFSKYTTAVARSTGRCE